MDENILSDTRKPSPWGMVAGILFALNGIVSIILNAVASGWSYQIINPMSLIVAPFCIKGSRGKGMLLATGLSAALSLCFIIWHYYNDLYFTTYVGYVLIFLFCLKVLLVGKAEKITAFVQKLWFLPALCPLLTFFRFFSYNDGFDTYYSYLDYDDMLDIFTEYLSPIILFLAMLAAGYWLVKPDVILTEFNVKNVDTHFATPQRGGIWKMFENVEGKLKFAAMFTVVIGTLAGLLLWIALSLTKHTLIGLFFGTMWIFSYLILAWFTYGFAELLESSKKSQYILQVVYKDDIMPK